MKIIRSVLAPTPFLIADSNLTSSDVTETEYAAWSSGVSYNIGNRAQIVSPTSAVTFGLPAPDANAVAWTAHGLQDKTPVRFTTTGVLPAVLTSGKIYFVKTPSVYAVSSVADRFYISATPGGAIIAIAGGGSGTHTAVATRHDIYESLVGSNLNNPPASNPSKWARVDSTNRWRMFDSSVSSQTSRVTQIEVEIIAPSIIDAVALLNINAASVRVRQTDPSDGVVYDKTISGVAPLGASDFYAYCFDPVVRRTEMLFTDLKPYATSTLKITLTDTGNTVLCGACVPGKVLDIGGTSFGMTMGVDDYSIKQQDSWGNYTIQERTYRRWVSGEVWVDNDKVDGLINVLAGYRATPVVYIGDESFGASATMGFYERFSTLVRHPTQSLLAIEIKGLT